MRLMACDKKKRRKVWEEEIATTQKKCRKKTARSKALHTTSEHLARSTDFGCHFG